MHEHCAINTHIKPHPVIRSYSSLKIEFDFYPQDNFVLVCFLLTHQHITHTTEINIKLYAEHY